jgi:hypothetical protein
MTGTVVRRTTIRAIGPRALVIKSQAGAVSTRKHKKICKKNSGSANYLGGLKVIRLRLGCEQASLRIPPRLTISLANNRHA